MRWRMAQLKMHVYGSVALLTFLAQVNGQITDCICPAVYNPVCDTSSGRTYSNGCAASCAGAAFKSIIQGECPEDLVSARHPDQDPEPAIGFPSNGTSAHAPVPSPPEDADCACPAVYEPVCDTGTGRTWGNMCEASNCGSRDTGEVVEGECPEPPPYALPPSAAPPIAAAPEDRSFQVEQDSPCACTREYDPLCDPATGTTYSNECNASACETRSIEGFVRGECAEVSEDPSRALPILRMALHSLFILIALLVIIT